MRDLFEERPLDPRDAARRGARRSLPRRFYDRVTAGQAAYGGYEVRLDDKPIHTPARRLLAMPTLDLAETLAAEWQTQRDVIDPASMPLTRLANVIIDGVAGAPVRVAEDVGKYLASDLLFYQASTPDKLRERQTHEWGPTLQWARDELGADFKTVQGVIHIAQSEAALAAARAAIPTDQWRLGAVHTVTTLTGSALLALAIARGNISADAAWRAAHVDEDWNMEQWGRDEMAVERRAFQFREFETAVKVLHALASP